VLNAFELDQHGAKADQSRGAREGGSKAHGPDLDSYASILAPRPIAQKYSIDRRGSQRHAAQLSATIKTLRDTRHVVSVLAAATFFAAIPMAAIAQNDYPSRKVKIIVRLPYRVESPRPDLWASIQSFQPGEPGSGGLSLARLYTSQACHSGVV
jgi:hypothetical protein